jgi:hypothetical protein
LPLRTCAAGSSKCSRSVHKNNGIVNFIDKDWNIVAGSLVTDGAIRAS